MLVTPLLGFAAGSGDVVADHDALLESGLFVQGASRSGKTNVVRVLLEQTYGEVLHLIFDPDGEYVSLRSSDRPYLIVGRGRDVELVPDGAAVRKLVLAVIERHVSTIIDLSEYDTPEQQVIVSAACDAMVSLPHNHPGTKYVVIEELQDFAPESGGKDTALDAVRRLAKRGLKRGTVGVSQRVADASKGVVTQLKTKIIGGTDQKDVPRALEELGLPRTERAALADLPQGEFWVKGPAFARHAQRVHAPRAESAPPKRRRGEPPAPAPEAPAEIAALAAALRAAVQEPAAEPHQTGEGCSSPTPGDATEEQLAAARHEGAQMEYERHHRRNLVVVGEVCGVVDLLRQAAARLEAVCEETRSFKSPAAMSPSASGFDAVIASEDYAGSRAEVQVGNAKKDNGRQSSQRVDGGQQSRRTTGPAVAPSSAGSVERRLPRAQQAILDAIAFWESLGVRAPSRAQVAAIAGMTEKVSTWRIHIGALRKGLIQDAGDGFALTAEGRAIANATAAPTSRAELHQLWLSRLDASAQRRMLEALIDSYPEALDRQTLGARAGVDPNVSTFRIHLGRLRKFNLVEGSEELRAAEVLFPAGLR